MAATYGQLYICLLIHDTTPLIIIQRKHTCFISETSNSSTHRPITFCCPSQYTECVMNVSLQVSELEVKCRCRRYILSGIIEKCDICSHKYCVSSDDTIPFSW